MEKDGKTISGTTQQENRDTLFPSKETQRLYAYITAFGITVLGIGLNLGIKSNFSFAPSTNRTVHIPNWDLTETTQAGILLVLGGMSKITINTSIVNDVSPAAKVVLDVCDESKEIAQWCMRSVMSIMK